MEHLDGYGIAPLSPDRWPDFETVIGVSGRSGCWCMYWLTDGSAAFRDGSASGASAPNRAAFQTIVSDGPPPGLLAYDGDKPVGWVRVLPRAGLPGLARSRVFKTDLDTNSVWSLSCFVVRSGWRRKGLTGVLSRAAIAHARKQGARILEAYPTDTDRKRSATAVYLGLASTFRRLGFDEVQRTALDKPMMRLTL